MPHHRGQRRYFITEAGGDASGIQTVPCGATVRAAAHSLRAPEALTRPPASGTVVSVKAEAGAELPDDLLQERRGALDVGRAHFLQGAGREAGVLARLQHEGLVDDLA